jgi:hypothetical protein
MLDCPEKSRLMDQYSAAIAEFSRVAAILNARMGVMFKGDYGRMADAMKAAREASEQCHRALLAHIVEHGC